MLHGKRLMGCTKHQGVKWNWYCKLGSVIIQIIGPGRGNGVTTSRYIDQVLRLHVVPCLARHRYYSFQHDIYRTHYVRVTTDFLQQNNTQVMSWHALGPDICGMRFKDDLMKSNQIRQHSLNLVRLS